MGTPPPARYFHSMTYFHERSQITIAGGRNDQLSEIVLDDVWVLRLDDLEYQQVLIKSNLKFQPRYCHTAAQFGSRLLVLGGMSGAMSFLMDAQEIELDPEKIEEMVENDKKQSAYIKKRQRYNSEEELIDP